MNKGSSKKGLFLLLWGLVFSSPLPAEVKIQQGHSTRITAQSFSLDNSLAATGDKGGELVLWETATGRELQRYTRRERMDFRELIFLKDNQNILALQWLGPPILWNFRTGIVKDLPIDSLISFKSMVLSQDEKFLVMGDGGGFLRTFEFPSGKILKSVRAHEDELLHLALSSNGKYIATSSQEANLTVKVWDAGTLTQTSALKGLEYNPSSLCFSPDSRTLGASARIQIMAWDPVTGQSKFSFTKPGLSMAQLWYSQDGKSIILQGNNGLIVLDSAAGQEKITPLTNPKISMDPGVISLDQTLILAPQSPKLLLLNGRTGQIIRELKSFGEKHQSLAWLPDSRRALTRNWEGDVMLWDLAAGTLEKTFDDPSQNTFAMALAPDGKTLVTASYSQILYWDTGAKEKIVKTPSWQSKGHSDSVLSLCFSKDGKTLLSGSSDRTLRLWNTSNGAEIRVFKGHTDSITHGSFSPDQKKILSASRDRSIKLWDLGTGKEIFSVSGEETPTFALFSPDGSSIFARYNSIKGTVVRLLDPLTGQVKKEAVLSTDFYPKELQADGKTLLGSDYYQGQVAYLDISSLQIIKELRLHRSAVNQASTSPDGKFLLSTGDDASVILTHSPTGKGIFTIASTQSAKEYIFWTPDGYFTGTPGALGTMIHVVDGLKTFGIDQFYDQFYRPDVVSSRTGLGSLVTNPPTKTLDQTLTEQGTPPTITFITTSGVSEKRETLVKLLVKDTGGGVGKICLYLDGTPVVVSAPGRGLTVQPPSPGQGQKTYSFEVTITLRFGHNRLEAGAFNKAGTVESQRSLLELDFKKDTPLKPRLFIFAMAINQYRDKSLRLQFAQSDAAALTSALGSKTNTLYESIEVTKLYDAGATVPGFIAQCDVLASQIRPDDVFILYLAGHGVTNEADGDYYFLPVDFRYTGNQAIAVSGLSKNLIVENLAKLKAQKTILLFDTCNSGSFLLGPDEKNRGQSRGLAEKTAIDRLKKATGRAVIVASTDTQVALEGIENHGVFTYALLKGLEGKADLNTNGVITVSELSAFVESLVPDLTYEKWGYEQVPQKELPREDFPLFVGKFPGQK